MSRTLSYVCSYTYVHIYLYTYACVNCECHRKAIEVCELPIKNKCAYTIHMYIHMCMLVYANVIKIANVKIYGMADM